MIKTTNKQNGFTLIEAMLAIVVIAILAIYAVNFTRGYNQRKNIQYTVQQFQNLLQLGVSYHSRENEWPEKLSDLKKEYVTDMDLCSSWPGTSSNNSCRSREVYKLADYPTNKDYRSSSHYGIKLTLPNNQLARLIAGKLPSSSISGNTVTAYTTAELPFTPGDEESPIDAKGWLNSAGIVNDGDEIAMPVCPEGYEGHVIQTPQRFSGDTKKYKSGFAGLGSKRVWYNLRYEYYGSAVEDAKDDDPYVSVHHDEDRKAGTERHYAYFMTMCLPLKQWSPQGFDSASEAQCQNAWLDYNGPDINPCGAGWPR